MAGKMFSLHSPRNDVVNKECSAKLALAISSDSPDCAARCGSGGEMSDEGFDLLTGSLARVERSELGPGLFSTLLDRDRNPVEPRERKTVERFVVRVTLVP